MGRCTGCFKKMRVPRQNVQGTCSSPLTPAQTSDPERRFLSNTPVLAHTFEYNPGRARPRAQGRPYFYGRKPGGRKANPREPGPKPYLKSTPELGKLIARVPNYVRKVHDES